MLLRLWQITTEELKIVVRQLENELKLVKSELARSRSEIGFRWFDKKRNLTKRLLFYQNLFVSGLKVVLDSVTKREKIFITWKSSWQSKLLAVWQLSDKTKEKSTFGVEYKRKNVRNHWFADLEFKILFVNLWQFCAVEKTRKRNHNKSTVFALFGWKIWFNRRKNCRISGWKLIYRLKFWRLTTDKTTNA